MGERVLVDTDPGSRTWVPPHDRRVTTLSQDPVLFPHLTVLGNVMFPLRAQGVPRREARRRAEVHLEQMGLAELAACDVVVCRAGAITVSELCSAGVASLLFTDIGRDGLLTGCNIDATLDLARRTTLPVIASGGVKGLDDIHVLSLHAREGIEGVITGRALYDGRLDLAAALAMAARG